MSSLHSLSAAILLIPLATHLPFSLFPYFFTFIPWVVVKHGRDQRRKKADRHWYQGDSADTWSSLDFPVSWGHNLPRSPNIRRNLRNHLMMSKLPILWVRKLNHREDLTWPPYNIGQAWARTQVSRIPIQKKRRPTPFPSQPGFPVFTKHLTYFLAQLWKYQIVPRFWPRQILLCAYKDAHLPGHQ